MINAPATQSASVRQAETTTPDPESNYIRLDATTGAQVRGLLDVERTAEIGDLRTINSATLHLFLAAAWAVGNHTVTVEALTGVWDSTSATWTNQPGVRTPTASVVVAGASSSDGYEIEIDVTTQLQNAIAENDAEGSRWYGWRVSVNTNGEKLLYSAFANPALRPYMEIDPVTPPQEPDNLRPSGTRAVSKSKPLLQCDFFDDDANDYITAMRVEVSTDESFTTTDYNSGKVTVDAPEFDLNAPPAGAPAFTAIANNVVRYWRAKVWDRHNQESDWSEPAAFFYDAKGTIALTAPTISGGTIANPTPTITVTFTPVSSETLEWAEIAIEKKLGDLWVEHWSYPQQLASGTSVTTTVPDDDALSEGFSYRIVARAADSEDREDYAGDRAFMEVVSATFSLAAA